MKQLNMTTILSKGNKHDKAFQSEHIGRLARMSILDTEVDGSNPAAECCFLGQDTLPALLQSTQL